MQRNWKVTIKIESMGFPVSTARNYEARREGLFNENTYKKNDKHMLSNKLNKPNTHIWKALISDGSN